MAVKTKKFVAAAKAAAGRRRPRARIEEDPLRQILQAAPPAEPIFLEPMRCKLVSKLPVSGDWVYELKFDGFRAMAVKNGREVRLISRNGSDLSERFPELTEALRKLKVARAALDGEIVMLDEASHPSFQALQNLGSSEAERRRLFYFAFDVVNYNGRDLTQLPLEDRKYVLQSLAQRPISRVRYVRAQQKPPEELLARVEQQGLEGLIAKKRLSRYEPGQRTGAWLNYENVLSQGLREDRSPTEVVVERPDYAG